MGGEAQGLTTQLLQGNASLYHTKETMASRPYFHVAYFYMPRGAHTDDDLTPSHSERHVSAT